MKERAKPRISFEFSYPAARWIVNYSGVHKGNSVC
jgi:hypothetical protein